MKINEYHSLFKEQYGDLPVGGFINPKIVEEGDRDIIFRCHYDNYEDDSWYYGFNLKTRQFYEA
jgi:hypothetical protein